MKAKSKYNKSLILKHTWMLFRNQEVNTSAMFGKCFKQSWHIAKTDPMSLHYMTISNLYKMYGAKVLGYITQKSTNIDHSDAQMLCNDVFIKANNYIDGFDSKKSKITTWLCNIANTIVLDWYREEKSKRDRYMNTSDFTDEDGKDIYQFIADNDTMKVVENNELDAQIAKAFNKMKPNYKKVATLFFLDGMQYNEIAEICDIPMGTVKGMINRCRTTLQRELHNEKKMLFV